MNVTRTIDAPVETVFRTVSDISKFKEAIPHIVEVEILSDIKSGVGTRFRETRIMKGKPATTELEVTEFAENERVRIVADSHGTVWDTVFTVEEKDGKTELNMVMDARTTKLLAKMMIPLVMGMIRKAVEGDMDSVKAYCESGGPA
jgi:carbon monoxide dehydrogenase subunit G